MWAYANIQLFMIFGGAFPRESCMNETSGESIDVDQLNNGDQVEQLRSGGNTTNCNQTYTFFSIVAQWGLDVGDKRYIPGTITTIQMIGVLIGTLVSGVLSDKFGRRRTLIILIVVQNVTLVIRTISNSWKMFTVTALILGLTDGGVLPINLVYFIEICVARRRTLFALTGWVPGCLVLGFLAYLTQHWKRLTYTTLAISLPSLLALILIGKPSPKWLMTNGKPEVAGQVLVQIAKVNGATKFDPSIVEEVAMQTQSDNTAYGSTYNYWHLFYNRKVTLHNLAIFLTWMNLTVIFNGISFGLHNLPGNIYVTFIITQMMAYGACLLVPLLDAHVKQVGRRQILLCSLMVQTICMLYILMAYCSTIQVQYPSTITAASIIGIVANQVAWIPAELVIPEFYPTELRTMGYSINTSMAKISSIAAPQILLLYEVWVPSVFIAFSAISLINLVHGWFYFPETKNQHLPDLPNKNTVNGQQT